MSGDYLPLFVVFNYGPIYAETLSPVLFRRKHTTDRLRSFMLQKTKTPLVFNEQGLIFIVVLTGQFSNHFLQDLKKLAG